MGFSTPSLGAMKHITLIILLIVLAGCPAESRIYLHNKSQETIVYQGYNETETVTINSGKTKVVYFDLTSLEECFKLEINGATRAFSLDREHLNKSVKPAGYGERFDVYYEYDRLYIQTKTGGWLEFETIANCQNTYRRYISNFGSE
jgi:hypothetical protein